MAKKITDKLLLDALTKSKSKGKTKSLNVDQMPSLNVNTTNARDRFVRLGKEDLKSGKVRMETMMAGMGAIDHPFYRGLGNEYFTNPKFKSLMDKKPVKQMKKGGKVKAKKPKDGRMKKAKCRDGIAQRGKTRGRMR